MIYPRDLQKQRVDLLRSGFDFHTRLKFHHPRLLFGEQDRYDIRLDRVECLVQE